MEIASTNCNRDYAVVIGYLIDSVKYLLSDDDGLALRSLEIAKATFIRLLDEGGK